jgi:divalent metal cation (Fe/Co/Zn/Cd) transporter
MQPNQIFSIIAIIVLTVLSGLTDAQGAVSASRMWQNGQLVPGELARASFFFAVGIALFFVAIRFMQQVGIVSAEIQSALWYSVVIVGIALISRAFFRWNIVDQIVALVVLGGILWLAVRTGA